MLQPEDILKGFITLIALFQIISFWRTRQKVARFRTFFPSANAPFHLEKNGHVAVAASDSVDFDAALESLNRYLDRSRGSVPEYQLMKSIVDSPIDAIEEEITASIATPLYLGLIGTMAGVIFGVWGLDDKVLASLNSFSTNQAASSLLMSEGISDLLNGVKIAMIASALGLGLTTWLSGYIFKNAKTDSEHRKAAFFNFLQIELIPTLTEGLLDTLRRFQGNFQQFNEDFSKNIRSLNRVLLTSSQAVESHGKILENINMDNLVQVAGFNGMTMTQLRETVSQLAQFNRYLAQLNEFNEGNRQLTTEVRAILDQTAVVEILAQKIASNFDKHDGLMNLLGTSFQTVQDYEASMNKTLGGFDKALIDSVRVLERSAGEQIEHYKGFVNSTENDLRRAVSENQSTFKKLDLLAEVVAQNRAQAASINLLRQAMAETNSQAQAQTALLARIANRKTTFQQILIIVQDAKNRVFPAQKIEKPQL